ncbi:MAG: hypothetical protein KatS3mg111_0130 [Pirellulaceae bacterium]|nr:MAG: hypothetical protein KatS3mg111_0130 [Pirellulaceae bacterium]
MVNRRSVSWYKKHMRRLMTFSFLMAAVLLMLMLMLMLMPTARGRAQEATDPPKPNPDSNLTQTASVATSMEWIEVSPEGAYFQYADSGRRFTPWGLNYDHDPSGRLLEDYWDAEWDRVVSDFEEMKSLGANTVRIHLQYGRFMQAADQVRQEQLTRLRRLLDLAERLGLYVDITGLGCYHRRDVPEWYDRLEESERWASQAEFWRHVASVAADSPAVFCFDLMNEPVVPGGDRPRTDWLGPAFGDKHFVQFIALDRRGRERGDIARQWIEQLVKAIRRHDRRHLITVGLVPWSLDRPGLTSGFDPRRIADRLDFLSVHVYPEQDKIDESLELVRAFAAVGKPLLIEETFPLKCDIQSLEQFIDHADPFVAGWLGFYWGKSPDELQPPQTIGDAITHQWLTFFQAKAARRE